MKASEIIKELQYQVDVLGEDPDVIVNDSADEEDFQFAMIIDEIVPCRHGQLMIIAKDWYDE